MSRAEAPSAHIRLRISTLSLDHSIAFALPDMVASFTFAHRMR
jgi:hypothetical protein